jgi:Multiubiquitin
MSKKHKFKIENTTYEWDDQFITGAQIRSVGPGIPDNMDLYLKVPGRPGRLVANDETIDLDGEPSIEKFYSQQSSSTAGCI